VIAMAKKKAYVIDEDGYYDPQVALTAPIAYKGYRLVKRKAGEMWKSAFANYDMGKVINQIIMGIGIYLVMWVVYVFWFRSWLQIRVIMADLKKQIPELQNKIKETLPPPFGYQITDVNSIMEYFTKTYPQQIEDIKQDILTGLDALKEKYPWLH
jgi:hypothetical protein